MDPEQTSRGNRRPLIIAGIAIIALALLGLILYFVLRPSGGSNSSGSSETPAIELSSANDFNAYANYIITGEASIDRLTTELYDAYESDDAESSYAIFDAVYDKNLDFMNSAKEYFDAFYAAYQSEENVDGALVSALDGYSEMFNFIYQYSLTGVASEDELLSAYLSGTDIETFLAEKYAPYAALGSYVAADFVEQAASYDRLMYTLYNNYSANGCIINSAINWDCAETTMLDPSDLLDQLVDAKAGADSVVSSALDNVIYKCWDIDAIIYEPDGTEEENTNDSEELEIDASGLVEEDTGEGDEAEGEAQ